MNHRRPRIVLAPNAASAPVPRRNFLARALGAALGGAFLFQPREGRASTQAYEPFIGEISLFGFNFAPVGWALCNGQLLPISPNTALFSLLGTMYGGNGVNTFALPDLRGRVPLGVGQGPGLSDYSQGQYGGEENHILGVSEMPAHAHGSFVSNGLGTSDSPENAFPAKNPAGIPAFGGTANVTASPGQIGTNGGNQPHNNLSPYLALNWCIATQGIFPSRP